MKLRSKEVQIIFFKKKFETSEKSRAKSFDLFDFICRYDYNINYVILTDLTWDVVFNGKRSMEGVQLPWK